MVHQFIPMPKSSPGPSTEQSHRDTTLVLAQSEELRDEKGRYGRRAETSPKHPKTREFEAAI